MVVQASVKMTHVNLDIRVVFAQLLQSFRRGDDTHKLDVPAAMLFARSRSGASHCREEFTAEEDLDLACSILYEFIKEDFFYEA